MTEPILQAAENLLHPLADAALSEAKTYAQQELAQLEAELPGLLDGLGHDAHQLADAALTRLRNIVGHLEHKLTGQTDTPAAQ